tara:strand:- start:227 stop:382 length:156 start_codon:yes stop_codon:yes gene_type:complete
LKYFLTYVSFILVPPGGLEPPTTGTEIQCSIQLSYRGIIVGWLMGLEPTTS